MVQRESTVPEVVDTCGECGTKLDWAEDWCPSCERYVGEGVCPACGESWCDEHGRHLRECEEGVCWSDDDLEEGEEGESGEPSPSDDEGVPQEVGVSGAVHGAVPEDEDDGEVGGGSAG